MKQNIISFLYHIETTSFCKMAANFDDKELWKIKNVPFICQNNHNPAETISTDVMK